MWQGDFHPTSGLLHCCQVCGGSLTKCFVTILCLALWFKWEMRRIPGISHSKDVCDGELAHTQAGLLKSMESGLHKLVHAWCFLSSQSGSYKYFLRDFFKVNHIVRETKKTRKGRHIWMQACKELWLQPDWSCSACESFRAPFCDLGCGGGSASGEEIFQKEEGRRRFPGREVVFSRLVTVSSVT